MDDVYRNPGPLQFDGPGADSKAVTLCVEDQDYMGRIKKLQEYLDKVVKVLNFFFCSRPIIHIIASRMQVALEMFKFVLNEAWCRMKR